MLDITCVMSVYDEPMWMVERALRSMAGQTLPLREMIIVADKPDNAEMLAFLSRYAQASALPVRIEVNPGNLGLTRSLNRGFQMVHTAYVCRMDADDESMPERLERTAALIEGGADIAASAVTVVDETGRYSLDQRPMPGSYEAIRAISRYSSAVFHPTWLLKKSVWEQLGGYREAMTASQDYDFIMRALQAGFRVESVKEPLLRYTVRDGAISQRRVALQMYLALYAQDNVYRNGLFQPDIAARLEAGECPDFEAFRRYLPGFVRGGGKEKLCAALRGLAHSERFRRHFMNTLAQKLLRKYYLRKEQT